MISISGCTHFTCTGWKPINPSKHDKMTSGTEKQILAHDLYGEKQGCWK